MDNTIKKFDEFVNEEKSPDLVALKHIAKVIKTMDYMWMNSRLSEEDYNVYSSCRQKLWKILSDNGYLLQRNTYKLVKKTGDESKDLKNVSSPY